jgi:hypothetical protein
MEEIDSFVYVMLTAETHIILIHGACMGILTREWRVEMGWVFI